MWLCMNTAEAPAKSRRRIRKQDSDSEDDSSGGELDIIGLEESEVSANENASKPPKDCRDN